MRAWISRHKPWFLPPVCLVVLTTCDKTPTEPTPPPSSCQYSTAPVEFTPCMQAPGELTLTIFTTPSCTWSVSSTVPWTTVTANQSGKGPGTPRLRVSDNWDAPREGLVVVQGALSGQTASARIAQAGCIYFVSKDSMDFTASGGSSNFDVLQQSLPNSCGGPLQNACQWSAEPNVSWIAITSSMPRTGDDPVAFTVAPNDGAARSGAITVRDKVVRVNQAGR